ncbi:MAG: CPBP family intramembrane metalloprotease [Desulfobacteraceae bacterium]|nr:CPBP family intramembrane metalloprotease [Desulfobacteraceae bacterium]
MKYIKTHPLISFFIIVFAIMYLAGLVGIFELIAIPEIFLWILGSFAPTITVLIVLGITDGKPGIKKLFKHFLIWRVGFKWYFATVSIAILSIIISFAYLFSQNSAIPTIPILGIFLMLPMGLFLGPLSEEGGWSGFALPRLQSKYNAFTASLILGVLWAVWHVPLWFLPGSPQSTMPFWLFFIALVALRFIMGWAYNNTNGSLIIAVLFHLFFNFGNEFSVGTLGVPINSFLYLAVAALVIYAVLVIIFAGPKNLSRNNERVTHQ